MSGIARGFRYEWEKLIHDWQRTISLLVLLLFMVAIPLVACFIYMGAGASGVFGSTAWTDETEAHYLDLQSNALLYYEIAIGKAQWPEGSVSFPLDAAEQWRRYLYFTFVLSVKRIDFYSGFSLSGYPLDPQSGYGNDPHLAASRLFFFQNLAFMAIPVLFAVNVHRVFIEDRSSGFEKNYRSMGVDPNSLFRGKLVFSALSCLGATFFFFLVGLVFIDGEPMAVFDGSFHLTSVALVYFERWLIMIIVLSPFFAFDVLVAFLPKSQRYFLTLALGAALSLFPSFGYYSQNLSTSLKQGYLIHFPLYGFLACDGFRSTGVLEVVGWPILMALLMGALAFLMNSRCFKKNERNPA
ncbi:MAG: hypothetical protein LKG11_01315 [Bacilli bacterium]|jgi:hypothetical protein|nr:hypothetical protein [Bacilli bacterium]